MVHLHIVSWIVTIILFIASYQNFSNKQGPSPSFKPLRMALRLFLLLTLISGIWLVVKSFGMADANHMLLTLKMIGGLAVIALTEVTLAKKTKKQNSRGLFITTLVIALLTMILGTILPLGPITQLFGLS
ncbi:YisL family protein [Staphylococcus massiliensis]|uniref:YisL family protein n=1 Tax=Staphylococcus massiliensis TaxID=555791 RepID=UPI001EDCB1D5|nr:YisL family protein [Staphylococcus massiliensis]